VAETTIEKAKAALNAAEQVIILSHERPDGDAIGSLLALTLSLERAGKNVAAVLLEGVPSRFRFLPGADKVTSKIPGDGDLLILVDAADIQRTGFPVENLPRQPDINIDHHPTNTFFAGLNLVQETAVATVEIIYDLVVALSLPLNQSIAEVLLTGLLTDSLGFRTSNTTPKALRIAAELQELGADLPFLYRKAMGEKSLEAVKYWGLGLSRINLEDRLVWTSLSLDDRKKAVNVYKKMERKPVLAAGRTSFLETGELIRKCNLFITGDTGLMHLARGLNVPIVAIFGGTDPWRQKRRDPEKAHRPSNLHPPGHI